MNIRDEIVQARKIRLSKEGHSQGLILPQTRQLPLVPFGLSPFLIAEIKRRSPSKGDIQAKANPLKVAEKYRAFGVRHISILTEEAYFGGSLADLVAVKSAFPELAVLRKDFLLDEKDLEVSYLAGADAVLLIASLFNPEEFARLYLKAKEIGLEVLVEVHDQQDVEKIKPILPSLVGINCRDLKSFKIDLVFPLMISRFIDWPCQKVFESGISKPEDALLAVAAGFSGLLVGEALMRQPELVHELWAVFNKKASNFWGKLYQRYQTGRPLIKICGITNQVDAELAVELSADLLGFVFVPSSPRKVSSDLLKKLAYLPALKVGVVVADQKANLEPEVRNLLEANFIQAVQFHGQESPQACFPSAFPYYKALRLQNEDDVEKINTYNCPRVLIDAFVPGLEGGTGQTIKAELVKAACQKKPLWLAGGIGCDNLEKIITDFHPELIDCSSKLEESPGKKDKNLLKKFFSILGR